MCVNNVWKTFQLTGARFLEEPPIRVSYTLSTDTMGKSSPISIVLIRV